MLYWPARVEMKRSDLPSGAQLGVITRVAIFGWPATWEDSGSAVSWRSWPPCVDMIQIWLEPLRLLWNASHFPSGEGAGSVSRNLGSARRGLNCVAKPGDAQARPRARVRPKRGVSRLRITKAYLPRGRRSNTIRLYLWLFPGK